MDRNRMATARGDRVPFFDTVRNLAMASVVAYHVVAAYSTVTPHWGVHDGSFAVADIIRHLFDVFQMPVFFFVAGYLAPASLARQGWWGFLAGKLRRIGVPWAIAIFLVIPVLRYARPDAAPHESFWAGWLSYLGRFGTFRIGLFTPDRPNQMHFWFLSLLLAFFIAAALVYALRGRSADRTGGFLAAPPATGASILAALAVTAVVTSLAYFTLMLLMPETTWASVDLLLFFQPASLVTYIASFVLGMFAASRQWFDGDAFPGMPAVWAAAAALLAIAFFATGGEVFAHPATSYRLPALLLLVFSIVRTLLCLAFLVLIIAFSRRYGSSPSRASRGLARHSYSIYLAHLFFVMGFQGGFTEWTAGPPAAKAAIAFPLVFALSYGLAWVMDRFPRAFAAFLVALFVLFCIVK